MINKYFLSHVATCSNGQCTSDAAIALSLSSLPVLFPFIYIFLPFSLIYLSSSLFFIFILSFSISFYLSSFLYRFPSLLYPVCIIVHYALIAVAIHYPYVSLRSSHDHLRCELLAINSNLCFCL